MEVSAPLQIVVPDPSLVVLVGAAGAGKSTFAAHHFAPDEVLSSDAFRALVAGDPADQRATSRAFAALHRTLARRALAGRLTVIDATNVRDAARRGLLARVAPARLASVAIVLDLPERLVLARNAQRPGPAAVPEEAVRVQLADLARTLAADPTVAFAGFAAVHVLRSPADVERVRILRRPAGAA